MSATTARSGAGVRRCAVEVAETDGGEMALRVTGGVPYRWWAHCWRLLSDTGRRRALHVLTSTVVRREVAVPGVLDVVPLALP